LLGCFVVYYFDDMLFYYGNGSKERDHSGPIRALVQQVLDDPSSSTWRYDATLTWRGEAVDNTLHENGFSSGRVLGWRTQDECRKGGLAGLVAKSVQRPDGARVKKALVTLIGWQEHYGPVPTMGLCDRAHAAWNGIAPLG
jgi:hypothetical protein